jgi:hypothetical protein
MGAPLAPVPGILKVFLKGFVDNLAKDVWGNILHLRYTQTPPTQTQLQSACTQVINNWASYMAPECPSPTQLNQVTITDLSSDSAAEATVDVTQPGTRGDDSIPANAAVLITYPSATRYRGGHPRTYLYVGGNADLQGATEWSTAFASEALSHWNNFLTQTRQNINLIFPTDTWGFVRYHGKYLPNGGPPHYYLDNPIFTPISQTAMEAALEMASQRRRIGRRKS